jgi:hypothetical protein
MGKPLKTCDNVIKRITELKLAYGQGPKLKGLAK